MILRPSSISKSTLPTIAKAIQSLSHNEESPLSLPVYSFKDAIMSCLRYEKDTTLCLLNILLSTSTFNIQNSSLSMQPSPFSIQFNTLLSVYDGDIPPPPELDGCIEHIQIQLSEIQMKEV